MTSGREDWQQHRGDMQNDRQDWRDNNREDWQNFGEAYHGSWYNGHWDAGDGWNYMWNNYPGAAAIGVTRWGVNRLAYGFGYWGYANPYYGGGYNTSSYGYNYSEPLVSYASSGESAAAPTDPGAATAASDPASPPQPTDEGTAAFDESRTAFYGGDYEKALTLLDTTLKTMPNDTVVHEFRGLVLFALKKYPESAAAIYAVLSAGPGWDWTTMSGLYPSVDVYTQQLRALETFASENPKSADASFLLGYHYLTTDYKEEASKYFGLALQQLPGDKLLTQLSGMTTPPADKAKSPPAPPAPADVPPEKVLTVEKVVGTWKASNADARFELQLAAEGTFVWSFSRGTTKESVKGVFAVDQNNLAMEPDAGGTMLAEIDFSSPTKFNFKMVGGEANDPGLTFMKN
jgi:tetratricopeptide (TPR) repeat protein